MAIRNKLHYIFIALLLCATVAAAAVAAFVLRGTALAEGDDPDVCALTPVRTEQADMTYYCFESPVSVFYDVAGGIVTGEQGTYFISSSTDSSVREIRHRELAADKLYRHTVPENSAEFLVVLRDGRLYSYPDDGEGTELEVEGASGSITDFDVENGVLYAVTKTQLITAKLGDTEIDAATLHTAVLASDRHTSVRAERVTVMDGNIYVTVNSVFGNKHDVCSAAVEGVFDAASVTMSTVLMQSDKILALTSSADNGTVYALTRSALTGYILSVGRGLYEVCNSDGSDLIEIYADRDSVYALDSLNALHEYTDDLTAETTIVAAAGDAAGFFNIPSGIAAKNSALYIADTMNNRIAIYGQSGIKYINRVFANPISATIDNAGVLYVAYDNNKVGVFHSAAYTEDDEIVITDTALGKIKQILVDNEKSLFVLAESGLWKSTSGGALLRISEKAYKAISLSIGKNKLFALDHDKVVGLDKNGGETKQSYSASDDAISVAVDLNDTAFILYRDKVTSVSTDGKQTDFALTCDDEPFTMSDKSGQIMLCFVEDGFADDGEFTDTNRILILDTYRHRIFKAHGDDLGARFVDYSYNAPDIAGNTAATAAQTGIIRTVKTDARLFAYPIETKSEYTVIAGRNVIVPDYSIVAPWYDPSETPEFALVLVDDTINNRLIQGFVYKDVLSAPLEYSAPPSEICTVFAELGTPIYKWPSRNAKAVSGYTDVQKNVKLRMLDFVGAFRDDYGFYWYRVELPDSTDDGYIPAVSISTIDYRQTNILPEYNAEIISYKNSTFAKAYTTDKSGKYVEISDFTLKTGTKIEVVGTFDTSERYTKIKFLNEKTHKTITCYVETNYVKYTGVNIVLIAAIAVIIITVILAIIIIARTSRAKKKRISQDDEAEATDKKE